MANYIAVIHKDQDSSFGVSFPDFPGCISAGASLRLNITMPEDLVQRMDARAEALGQTRSGFLANAVRHELSAATGR